jgi:glutaminase
LLDILVGANSPASRHVDLSLSVAIKIKDIPLKQTPCHDHIEELYQEFRALKEGAVADYIPELAKVDPDQFGIAIVTVDGHVYQAGDSRQEFSIQSISKAFTYGIALEDQGVAEVEARVDVEPSGEAFNSISLEPETGRPRNPMINAGAIATTALVSGNSVQEKIDRILEVFAWYSGRDLRVDEEVYESEKATGHRNRAISHLLRNYDILSGDPEEALDVYFRQCSISVTCRDLALMGATLANDGVNPITGVRALGSEQVPRVLGVMASCGMYDYSGNWIYRVGMPAKSGVGGGIVAVLPGQLGLAVFSPRLDAKGNSVRGIAVCEALSRNFDLHMLHSTRTTTAAAIRMSYTAADVRSKLERSEEANRILLENGKSIRVLELMGDMQFVSAELVMAEVMSYATPPSHLILDFIHVTSVYHAAAQQLCELCAVLKGKGTQVLFTGVSGKFGFTKKLKSLLPSISDWPGMDFQDIDRALEFCEERVLSDGGWSPTGASAPVALSDQPLCKGFSKEELDFLEGLLDKQTFQQGEVICRDGETADRLYFLERGQVSAWVRLDRERKRRLNVIGSGWAFGESALFGDGRRIADVISDTDVSLSWLLPGKLFEDASPISTSVQTKLFKNLSALSFHRLRRLGEEIRILTQ